MSRRWKEKNRSLDTPLGRRYTKGIAKKLKKKGFTYKIKTDKQYVVIYQGRKKK